MSCICGCFDILGAFGVGSVVYKYCECHQPEADDRACAGNRNIHNNCKLGRK